MVSPPLARTESLLIKIQSYYIHKKSETYYPMTDCCLSSWFLKEVLKDEMTLFRGYWRRLTQLFTESKAKGKR